MSRGWSALTFTRGALAACPLLQTSMRASGRCGNFHEDFNVRSTSMNALVPMQQLQEKCITLAGHMSSVGDGF